MLQHRYATNMYTASRELAKIGDNCDTIHVVLWQSAAVTPTLKLPSVRTCSIHVYAIALIANVKFSRFKCLPFSAKIAGEF